MIFSESSSLFLELNGSSPVSMMNKSTPNDQTSAAHPLYGYLEWTSGAI